MASTITEERSQTQNNLSLTIKKKDFEKLGPYLNKVGFDLTKIQFFDWDIHGLDLKLPEIKGEQRGLITIKYNGDVHVHIGLPLNKSSDKFHRHFKTSFNQK